jgi:hypothetical protein
MLRRSILTITFFLSASVAAAEADNCPIALYENTVHAARDKIQGLIGRVDKCESMTVRDIKAYECKSSVKNLGPTLTMADDLNGIALGMFFQSLAGNSHRQANCRVGFFGKYFADDSARQKFNEKVEEAFNKVQPQLKALLDKRNKMQAYLNDANLAAAADRGMRAMTMTGREQTKKQIAEVNVKIARVLMNVPMGYDSDVARTLCQLSVDNKFDSKVFEQGMQLAVEKYEESSKFYQSKFTKITKDRGTYCLGLDYKNVAGESGQVDRMRIVLYRC